ncbi:MAG: hypothetical protein ABL907_20280 [Hyphomicrobium sp.]
MVPFNASHLSDDAEIVCHKSWTRYALNLAGLFGLLVVAVFVTTLSETAAMVLACAAIAFLHTDIWNCAVLASA